MWPCRPDPAGRPDPAINVHLHPQPDPSPPSRLRMPRQAQASRPCPTACHLPPPHLLRPCLNLWVHRPAECVDRLFKGVDHGLCLDHHHLAREVEVHIAVQGRGSVEAVHQAGAVACTGEPGGEGWGRYQRGGIRGRSRGGSTPRYRLVYNCFPDPVGGSPVRIWPGTIQVSRSR